MPSLYAMMDEDMDEFKEEIAKLREENKQLQKQRYDLYMDIARLVEENEQLQKDNKEYIRGLDLRRAEVQSWKSDVRELREQNCKLEKINKQLKDDLVELKEIGDYQEGRIKELDKENQQLEIELKGMEQLLRSYRKTIEHDAKLLSDATANGYLPPLEGWKEI